MSYLNSPGVNPDLLVVGMVGRKGPKSEPTLIGRTSDYALREARVSSCICKLHEVPAESVFAIAVDGSDRAHLGVALVERLSRPCDRVIVVHVEVSLWRFKFSAALPPATLWVRALWLGARAARGRRAHAHCLVISQDHSAQVGSLPQFRTAAVSARYSELCASRRHWEFDVVVKPADRPVSDVLQAYARDRVSPPLLSPTNHAALTRGPRCHPYPLLPQGVHHLVIGVDGLSALAEGHTPRLGGNTDTIAKCCRIDVICVQQKGRLFLSTPSARDFAPLDSSRSSSRLEPADFEHKGD